MFLVNSEWRMTVIFSISCRARSQVSTVDLMAVSSSDSSAVSRARSAARAGFRCTFLGRRTELLDLRSDGGELRAQRRGRIVRLGKDGLDVDTQTPELLFELGHVLDCLFRRLDRARQARHVLDDGRRQCGLGRLGLRLGRRRLRWDWGSAGGGAWATAGASHAIATRNAARRTRPSRPPRRTPGCDHGDRTRRGSGAAGEAAAATPGRHSHSRRSRPCHPTSPTASRG